MKAWRRNQINPSLFDHYYLEGFGRVNRLKEFFLSNFEGKLPANGLFLLLDLGGRESPYEQLAQRLPVRWISGDLTKYGRTDVVFKAEELPFKPGIFDSVLCTQVLGCIPNLFTAAREIHRILKPRGLAILTEAAIFPPYGEGARWRLLPEGWKTLLAGFSECKVDADLNTVASFFRVLNLFLSILLQKVPWLAKICGYVLCPAFNLLGRWANHCFNDSGFAANYSAIARK